MFSAIIIFYDTGFDCILLDFWLLFLTVIRIRFVRHNTISRKTRMHLSILNMNLIFFPIYFNICLFAAMIYRTFVLWPRNECSTTKQKRLLRNEKLIELNCTTRAMYSSSSSDTILQSSTFQFTCF